MSKKGILLCLTVIAFLLALLVTLTLILDHKTPAQAEIETYLGLSVEDGDVLYHTDSHGGFHGDGETCLIFSVSPENAEIIEATWPKVSENSQLSSFLSRKSEYNGSGFFLPAHGDDHGFFLDRSPEGQPDRWLNFVAAVYKPYLGQVYYYRFDS